MRKSILGLLAILVTFSSPTFAQQETTPVYLKVSITVPKAKLGFLLEQGMEFDHGTYDAEAGTWNTVVKKQELEVLKKNDIPYKVMIHDLNRYYKKNGSDLLPEEKNPNDGQNRLGFHGWDCNALDYPTPTLFPYPAGSMGGFLTYPEIVAHLDLLKATYPNLITTKFSIGQSHESRDLWMVKISDNPNADEPEPEIFYNSLIHAREPMSAASLIYYMDYLLQHYTTDPDIKDLVDNTEMYFLPVYNPDGYAYNYQTNPGGGGLWRKNRRLNGPGDYGVDLNRNYGHNWGLNNSGSSPSTAAATYRGPSAFSEPETQAVRDFTIARDFKLVYNVHTYGDYMIHPFDYINAPPPGLDGVVLTRLGRDICQHNSYHTGTAFGTLNYFVNGGASDWCFGDSVSKPKMYAYVPEIGPSFWPSVFQASFYGKEMMYTYLRSAYLVGDYAELEDWTDASVAATTGHFPFKLTRVGLKDGSTWTVSIQPLQGIASVGTPAVCTGMGQYHTVMDSVSFVLNSGLQPGNLIQYVWEVFNGSYTLRDTVTKVFQPTSLFIDNCESLVNWTTTGSWGLSTDALQGQRSITDSPAGGYNTGVATSYLYLNQGMDLSSSVEAFLTLWIKFQTAVGRDYVQIEVSPNGHGSGATGYQPVCGNLSQPSSGEDFLPASGPIYHGDSPNWQKETLSLKDFVGNADVGIRIKMEVTLGNITTPAVGFYVDKVSVTSSAQPTPFPLEIISFEAQAIDKGALLTWQASENLHSDYFEIERSTDGVTFNKIGQVLAHTQNEYQFTDNDVALLGQERMYYRLKTEHQNGSSLYSHTVEVNWRNENLDPVWIFPNPAKNELHISVSSQALQPVNIHIFDLAGRECGAFVCQPGIPYSVDIHQWKSGLYFVKISGENGPRTRKLVVE